MEVFIDKSELYEQNGSQRVGNLREFVKRGILKGTFFIDVGTDDYWGMIDAVFVENLVKLPNHGIKMVEKAAR
jgi:hypothetical protein